MFNMGISEMAIIAGLALILIGPKQLPEVARTLGRLLNDIRRSAGSFTDDIKRQVNIDQRNIFDRNNPAAPHVNNEPDQQTQAEATNHQTSEEKKS